ncbi:IclR family transcriptional regulator [Variovorax sp. J2P1-59]|uniref:IclR family transcriptional regulator n=1 Tax=Variovorax flavidus TaxID=3053501 RepID=UPI002578772D|nr:IclR family transcriptional regulator [Variovorax sp. J2P1-59]MDM0073455.1 IclR family transcriptional regulator [Variovorax sp. J2P1-59]
MAGSTKQLPAVSTRAQTRESGTFTRSTSGSQSLERGLQLLRSFRVGVPVLGNAELAERTGLPRPTVSRLTRSLVDAGFLAYDHESRGYRLTVAVMSLAQAFRYDVPVIDIALPLMKKVAEGEKINVGLAVADQSEMVYLESVRESRRGVFRRAEQGSRFPMELTAGGRAYLAGLSAAQRDIVMKMLAARHASHWARIRREIDEAGRGIARDGYCVASWQPGLTAIAAPLVAPDRSLYSVSIGFHLASGQQQELVQRYAPMLLELVDDIRVSWERRHRS